MTYNSYFFYRQQAMIQGKIEGTASRTKLIIGFFYPFQSTAATDIIMNVFSQVYRGINPQNISKRVYCLIGT